MVNDNGNKMATVEDKLRRNLVEITSLQRTIKGLEASKIRCEAGVSVWLTQVKEQLQMAGQQLMAEVEQVHMKEKMRLQQTELVLSRDTKDLWNLLGDGNKDLDISRLLDKQVELGPALGQVHFTPNAIFRNITKSTLGIFSVNGREFEAGGRILKDIECDTPNVIDNDAGIVESGSLKSKEPCRMECDSTTTDNRMDLQPSSPVQALPLSPVTVRERPVQTVRLSPVQIIRKSPLQTPVTDRPPLRRPLAKSGFKRLAANLGLEEEAGNTGGFVKKEVFISDPVLPEGEVVVTRDHRGPGEESFDVGSLVLARWSEDLVWYRAKVEAETQGEQFMVTFTDYGNSDTVGMENIVGSYKDIPEDQQDLVDENVEMPDQPSSVHVFEPGSPLKQTSPDVPEAAASASGKLLSAGDLCLVRKEEDQTWYHAKIHKKVHSQAFVVQYLHIHEFVLASRDRIVLNVHQVPQGEMINFTGYPDLEEVPVKSSPDVSKDLGLAVEEGGQWDEGELCVAKWEEDRVWYRARVDRRVGVDRYKVTFTDFGNQAEVSDEHVLKDFDDVVDGELISDVVEREKLVPADLQCSLCHRLSRLGMRLSCDGSVVCWGCAVKQVNLHHTCWRCGQNRIKTSDHLRQDDNLRRAVKEFRKTGVNLLQGPGNVHDSSQVLVVSPPPPSFPIVSTVLKTEVLHAGDLCFARWSDDQVWYNCRVETVLSGGACVVVFVDYGNKDTVQVEFVVTNPALIPDGAFVDEHVSI